MRNPLKHWGNTRSRGQAIAQPGALTSLASPGALTSPAPLTRSGLVISSRTFFCPRSLFSPRTFFWLRLLIPLFFLLAPTLPTLAQDAGDPDASLTYETIEPSRIRMGDTATLRVVRLEGYVKPVTLPTVPGLTFEILGRTQGLDFVNGKSILSTSILIKVTPQFTGVFTIPGLTPKSRTLGLEVIKGDEPNPYALQSNKPKPLPVKPAPVPKGVELQAGGAAFVRLIMPTRPVYVGESVPVEIQLGVRPGIVTSLKGLPTLSGGDFTLNDLSRKPKEVEQDIEGSPFVIWTWHSIMAAVKPGDYALSVTTPLSVRVNKHSAQETEIAARMGWLFLQSLYNSMTPKDVSIESPATKLKVLPLPTQGQPQDFTGAVGEFQVSSDVSPAHSGVGDPITLRLHVNGTGNFDRVDSQMLTSLDHWKTYPAKSTFNKSDEAGYKGDKVFEQPLIANLTGEQTLPPLQFSYFNPNTQRYERALTQPVKVTIGTTLADSSLNAPTGATGNSPIRGLRADHPLSKDTVEDLRPLYFQPLFLAAPATLLLLLAGGWFGIRVQPVRSNSKTAADRALAKLDATARSGNAVAFFELARTTLSQFGASGEDAKRLYAVADEVKYSNGAENVDFQHWIGVIRGLLQGNKP